MTGIEELDENEIEEAIRRELDALDDLDIKDVESLSDSTYEKYTQADLSVTETKFSGEEKYGGPPDSVETFIRLLRSRNDKLEEELAKAQDALASGSHHENDVVPNNDCEMDEAKITPEVKEKVLNEIKNLEKYDNSPEIKPGDEDISSLEEIALRDLKDLEVKQHERSGQLEDLFNEIKKDEILRHEKEEKMREENKRKASEEHRMKMDKNQSHKIKIEKEARYQKNKLQDLQKQFESEMKDLERIQKEEGLALAKIKSEEKRKRDVQREVACVTIQKNFRKFRVLSKYGSTLKAKREERHKRRQEELDALERKEKRLMEEAVQKAKEEEMRRLKEIEMEKKRKEEEKIEEQKRKTAEIERKLKEERLEMERREQKERERKIEEERKKKEMREAEERHRIEEEKRLEEKRLEEKRLEEKILEEKILEEKRLEEKRLEEKRLEEKRLEEQMKMQKELEERMKLPEQEKESKHNGREERNKQWESGFEQSKRKKITQNEIDQEKSSEQETSQDSLQKFSTKKNDISAVGNKAKAKNSDLSSARSTEPSVVKDALNSSVSKNSNFESFNQANDSITGVLILKEQKIDDAICRTLRFKESLNANVHDCSFDISEWESRREDWLKRTILWSTLSKDEKTNAKSRSRPRRPLSASQKLPSISEDELLKSSNNKVTCLDKIVCINVKQLPARNLKIMSRCLNVKSVSVQSCSLLSAEDFDNCKYLVELNLSDNKIHNISLQNLESLEHLDLRNNQVTSIHGLDGSLNLRSLFLDGNKITRIGTLFSNKIIHLSLQSNQLITTKGLSTWKYLQILDCSNNHLSQVQELECCPLLRILKLRGNNLRKPPDLSNHVLLRELHLSENSISSLEDLSAHWLPLLQQLYLDSNSLTSVCTLRNFPVLETLDLKNNLISDEENLFPGLTGCHQLRTLHMQGNPLCEDSNARLGIFNALPKLQFLDGETLECALENSDTSGVKTIYHPISRAQVIAQDEILERQKTEIKSCQVESRDDNQILKKLSLQSRHFEEFQELLIKHRLEHEIFKKPCTNDVSLDIDSKASISSNHTKPNKHDTSKPLENFESHSMKICVSQDPSTTTAGEEIWKPNHHQAATLIQARFRGYRIRRRYLEATKTAQYSDIELEEDDFNFDEEVDLNVFDMDEAALDSSWVPTTSSQRTRDSSSLHIESSPPKQIGYTDHLIEKASQEEDSCRPFPRKQAWRSPESPVSSPNPRKVIPPIDAPSVLSEQTSPPGETHRSHKTTELSSEWGFRSDTTTELMLKRANRMKYNALRKKKLTDPGKRLQLFKKADESNKARGVQTMQKRKEKPRVDYFSGRPSGEDQQRSKTEDQHEQTKKEMTFSWLYDQAVLHKDQGEEILGETRGYYSEARPTKNRPERSPQGVSLPRMDPVILAGRNLPLVASPVGNPRTPSTGDVGISPHRQYSWQQTKTHSNPDLSRVGKISQSRPGKSNSAEARIIRERNNIL